MTRRKLTREQISEIRGIYSDPDSALTYADLAAEYGVSEATIRYHLVDLAKPTHQRGPAPKICFERLMEMRSRNVPTGTIARLMKVERSSVYRAIRKLEMRA